MIVVGPLCTVFIDWLEDEIDVKIACAEILRFILENLWCNKNSSNLVQIHCMHMRRHEWDKMCYQNDI